MPPYTQPRATSQGFRMGSYTNSMPPPGLSIPLPPNPFGSPTRSTPFGASRSSSAFQYPSAYTARSAPQAPSRGIGGASGWSGGSDPISGFLGGSGASGGQPGLDSGGWASPLPPGGVYGASGKWNGGSAVDVFVRRGTPIFAPFDGMMSPEVQTPGPSPIGPVPGFTIRGQNGAAMQVAHATMTARGMVRKGQQIGVVNDPSMDMLGPYQGMPDGFQHADLRFSRSGQFSPFGGDLDGRQVLQQIGYQGQAVPGITRGPNSAGGGGMFGMPGGGFGGMPGMGMGGPPGMGMGMPPNPFMMGGMPPMGMMGMGMNPFMGMFGGMR